MQFLKEPVKIPAAKADAMAGFIKGNPGDDGRINFLPLLLWQAVKRLSDAEFAF